LIKRLVHILVVSLTIASASAQNKQAIVKITSSDKNTEFATTRFVYADTLQLVQGINNEINTLHANGFLLAGVKKMVSKDSTANVEIDAGSQFKWAWLHPGNVPEEVLSRIGYRQRFYENRPFKAKQVNKLFERLLDFNQDSGYPFASITFDSVFIDNVSIGAKLNLDRGPLITFDSIVYDNQLGVKRGWLAAYLGIVSNNAFDQELVDKISKKISNLDFLKLKQPPAISFRNEKAEVTFVLEKIPANKVDGIVGFLPNEKTDGGTLITGQFDMELSNLFNSGKSLDVHWQSLKPRSQLLEIGYLHRNLFHSPLHFDANFSLLKEDTIFVNRKGQFTFRYQPSNHQISLFTRLQSSRLLGSNEEVEGQTDISDFNVNYYGASYEFSNVTRAVVPRGLQSIAEVAIGNKVIRNSNKLPPELLDEIDLESTQLSFYSKVSWQQPISKIFGGLLSFEGGKLINDQLFINDLFRVGGLQSLRGFNENFFFASEYAIAKAELRLYYESKSYLFLFYDQAYLYYNVRQSRLEDYPLGIGVGLSFSTKGGVLNLAYALGKSEEQPLSLSLSKFHFGYVANF